MSKLACNIVSYRPDPDMLAAKFRFWDVEALLDQAATLMDRCIVDFREYSSLDFAWNQFRTDLETQEKQLDLDMRCEAQYSFGREEPVAEEEPPPTGEPVEEPAAEEPAAEEEGEPEEAVEAAPEPAPEPAPEAGTVSFAKRNLDLRAEALQRKKELAAPGRPFALDGQRDLVLKRLCRDYEEAVNRAVVAEEGLKKIYDHAGLSSPLPSEAEALGASITNLSMWIRDAIEWLEGYRQMEQAFTRVVSVRSIVGRHTWAQVKHARESFSLKLQVPVELFRGYDNCRLRGLAASLIGEAGTVPWSINLRLPEDAVYERSGQVVEVDQSALPSCYFGRVENRRSARPTEICGADTLNNASPIGGSGQRGFWSLEILKPLGAASETFGNVEDVVLEINVVGIPQKISSRQLYVARAGGEEAPI